MHEYEIVFITQPELSDSQLTEITKRVDGMIDQHEGRTFFTRSMGKKQLAYPIQKQTKGVYTLVDFAAQGGCIAKIERSLRLDENVLRFLTVVRNKDIDVEARATEVIARGEDRPPESAVEVAPPAVEAETKTTVTSPPAEATAGDTETEEVKK